MRRSPIKAPGMGPSRGAIVQLLKHEGRATIPQLAQDLGLNIETIRDHLKTLVSRGLVRREGNRTSGPGRPEGVYVLTPEAESLFPRMEGTVLRELAAYLVQTGNEGTLKAFFNQRIGQRREEAMARVRRLKGRRRLNEVARILSELGFMARVEQEAGESRLRLCHCPIRDLINSTRVPCRAETGFLTELLGERPSRISYIPSGDSSCTYRIRA